MLPLGLLLTSCGKEQVDQLPINEMVVAQSCDIRLGCLVEGEGHSLDLSMGPEVRALKPFPVSVKIRRGKSITSMTVAFGMKGMEMGLNRYTFIEDGATAWHANVTLPVCISGRTDWIANFEMLADGKRYQFQVPFMLEK